MSNFGMVLFLVGIVFFIFGLIKPNKSLFWLKGLRTRKKSSYIYGILTLVGFILVGAFSPQSSTSSNINQQLKGTDVSQTISKKLNRNQKIQLLLHLQKLQPQKWLQRLQKTLQLQLLQLNQPLRQLPHPIEQHKLSNVVLTQWQVFIILLDLKLYPIVKLYLGQLSV